MISKFSLKYLILRFHQLFYFKQIIKRDFFNILIDKKLIPIYNLKGLIVNYDKHEIEEISLINNNLLPLNTLELGCSLGVVSLNIKRKILNKKLISIDGNLDAINYCKENLKYNPSYEIEYIHHSIGGNSNFVVDKNNFLSSRCHINEIDTINIKKSIQFVNQIINSNEINCLVIDIEGMEKFIFDNINLKNIKLIFVELHPSLYGKDCEKKILKNLLNNNFIIKEKINSNYCLENLN